MNEVRYFIITRLDPEDGTPLHAQEQPQQNFVRPELALAFSKVKGFDQQRLPDGTPALRVQEGRLTICETLEEAEQLEVQERKQRLISAARAKLTPEEREALGL
ncbi:hypothetical protein [Deinococcus sonorensis]|uniref:Uncharacterized protein n=2 Tax=Deinococcus sonorensis TaxID=309891 RepID=A0AAU7UFZ6_9DEIO